MLALVVVINLKVELREFFFGGRGEKMLRQVLVISLLKMAKRRLV